MTPWSAAVVWAIQTAVPEALSQRPAAAPSTFEVAAGIAVIVLAIVLIAVLVLLLLAAQRLRTTMGDAKGLLARLEAKLDPAIRHANAIAENAGFITAAVRSDVQRVSDVVDDAVERARRGLAAVEQRAGEVDAFLQVVQEEAEDAFIAAAASVRGVRRGASALRRTIRGRRGTNVADEDVFDDAPVNSVEEDLDDLEDAYDDDLEDELEDGFDDALDDDFEDELEDALDDEDEDELEDALDDEDEDEDDAEVEPGAGMGGALEGGARRRDVPGMLDDPAARGELDELEEFEAVHGLDDEHDEEDEDGELDTHRHRKPRPRIRRRGPTG